jgi:hypothetical protein
MPCSHNNNTQQRKEQKNYAGSGNPSPHISRGKKATLLEYNITAQASHLLGKDTRF